MIDIQHFGEVLKEYSFDFFSGVPCSFLKPMINYALNERQFVMAANEGDAVAICAGAALGGRKCVFLCQNSGLTNAVSPLTSLTATFQIPVLGFVSLRGEEGIPDEPQHELMGKITKQLLDVMQIENTILSTDLTEAVQQLAYAENVIEQGRSYFFIVRKDTFSSHKLLQQDEKTIQAKTYPSYQTSMPSASRIEALKCIKKNIEGQENTVLLATTGVTGRELFELGHIDCQFYMVGSMGCIGSIALGLALVRRDLNVIAIDGDGALLMRLGTLATNGYYAPPNLLHILLDNELHESTGSQRTVSSNVDFATIASAAGYERVEVIKDLEDLAKVTQSVSKKGACTFGYMKILAGIKEDLGRPTLTPLEIKERFCQRIQREVWQ